LEPREEIGDQGRTLEPSIISEESRLGELNHVLYEFLCVIV